MRKVWKSSEDRWLRSNWPKTSGVEAAAYLNTTVMSVKSRARRLGVKGRTLSERKRKFYFDPAAFEKKSLEACYWAGFLAADGYLAVVRGRPRLVCALASKDQEHLKKLCEFLKNDKPLAKVMSNGHPQYRMEIYGCDQLLQDLNFNFGVSRQKLKIFPPLKGNRLLAFTAGMLDGDGSLMWDNADLKYVSFAQANRRLASLVQTVVSSGALKKLSKYKNSYHFAVGRPHCHRFRLKILRLGLPIMPRKWRHL